jgi:hypothetical protein
LNVIHSLSCVRRNKHNNVVYSGTNFIDVSKKNNAAIYRVYLHGFTFQKMLEVTKMEPTFCESSFILFRFSFFLSMNIGKISCLLVKLQRSVDHTAITSAATTLVCVLIIYFRIFMESSLFIWPVSSRAISRVKVELSAVSGIVSSVTTVDMVSEEASVVSISLRTLNDGHGGSFRNVGY